MLLRTDYSGNSAGILDASLPQIVTLRLEVLSCENQLGHVTKVNKLRSGAGALPRSMAGFGEFRRWFLTHIRPIPIFHM